MHLIQKTKPTGQEIQPACPSQKLIFNNLVFLSRELINIIATKHQLHVCFLMLETLKYKMYFLTESQLTKLSCLLDRKRPVCDFASAMVNKSQLQTAECWRADFIFDPSDLHKLLVLGNIHFHLQFFILVNTSEKYLPKKHNKKKKNGFSLGEKIY